MDELHENPSTRNFTMLSRKMCALLLQYILGGRIRAPPEADLTFLISTFQYGARTDRRALQSKFKSWAKRMAVENNKLKLICTGKEIIPLEDSCKIVMRIHFQGHLSVNQVVKKIQQKYTWTKKNFGMDRNLISDFILRNCNNLSCIRALENENLGRNYQCGNFIKDVILSSESHNYDQPNEMMQNSASMTNPSALLGWPTGHPLSTSLCAIENTFPSDLKITEVRSMNTVSDNATGVTLSKNTPGNLKETDNVFKVPPDFKSSEKNNSLMVKKPLRVVPRSFRKPKNIVDFKALLSAAEQYTDYPAVLCNPKTKFLGSFGLAPKRICSKRTLSKVEKEKKRRKALCLQNMVYNLNRKNLRDRNKLNKIKLKEQLEKRAYLDKFKRNSMDEVPTMAPECFSDNMQDDSYYAASNSDESNNIINSADDSEVEIVKVVPNKDEPEVIDIVSSSDDENNCKTLRAILMNGNKNTTSVKNNNKTTKILSSQFLGKIGVLKFEQQDKKTSNSAASIHPETPLTYCPIFKQPFLLPSNSKGEVAVLPSSQWTPKVLLNQNKPVCSINSRATKSIKLTKGIVQGKKAILQPISTVMKAKNVNMQKLPTPVIANKIPLGTNIYLVKKQASGVIKMVPCSKVVPTNNTSAKCFKEIPRGDRPMSAMKSVNHVGIPNNTKYRNIRPVSDKIVEINRQKALDANKHFIDEEMNKLSKWVGGMKSTMARTYFQLNVQRSKQRLESQLNSAIALVKNIRRKLWEIEKLEEQVNRTSDILSTDTQNTQYVISGILNDLNNDKP